MLCNLLCACVRIVRRLRFAFVYGLGRRCCGGRQPHRCQVDRAKIGCRLRCFLCAHQCDETARFDAFGASPLQTGESVLLSCAVVSTSDGVAGEQVSGRGVV